MSAHPPSNAGKSGVQTGIPPTTSAAPLSPAPTTATSREAGPVWSLGRLTKIEIENYRAVRGHLELNMPNGENSAIYGENGSGKSSIFCALRDFLESPERYRFDGNKMVAETLQIEDRRHRYTTEKPRVALHFGNNQIIWSLLDKGPEQREARDLNKGKGFLDYPTLQAANHLPFEEQGQIDLFKLFIGRLLPYYAFPIGGRQEQLQQFWYKLNDTVRHQWHHNEQGPFLQALTAFNEALESAVNILGLRANRMLTKFGDDFQAEFQITKAEFKRGPKRIVPPRIVATPSFRKLRIDDYSRFLNEARLSALATCLFFGALKESPASSLRILALDDILIGLDMANRLIVLELVRENFSDWQIFIFTYSKAWFELLKEHVPLSDWAAKWRYFIVREEWQGEETSPRIVADGSGDLMQMAEYHLTRKDYKAAAVYGRSALESLCHRACARARLHVLHVEWSKERKVEDYLAAIEKRLGELLDQKRREIAQKLVVRLHGARAFVLNRRSHFDIEDEDTLSAEVSAAITVVKELGAFLEAQSWKPSNFAQGQVLSPTEKMALDLAEARKLKIFGQKRAAAKKMAGAHEHAWQSFGQRLMVAFSIGAALSARAIWDASVEQAKIDPEFDARLRAARPYLFGCVTEEAFDDMKFDDAAALIEELVQVSPTEATANVSS